VRPAGGGLRAWWQHRSIRLQLTAWYGAVLVVLVAVLGGLIYELLAGNLQHEVERQLAARAAEIRITLNGDEDNPKFQDVAAPGELLLFYDPDGTLKDSTSTPYRPAGLPAWANQAGSQGVYGAVTLPDGRWLLYAVPVGDEDHPADMGRLLVGRSLEPMYAMLQQTLSTFAVAGPLLVLFACLGGYFLAGRALAPVSAITHAAQRIRAEGLGPGTRIGMPARHDELGELSATLDAMLTQLEAAFMRERRFTADAAHELRTPLAVVETETSIALTRPRSAQEYQRVLAVVEGETARMGRLVTNLLALARADAGQHLLTWSPVRLDALCNSVANQMSSLAGEKGITLASHPDCEMTVLGDEIWLTQMLVNLVDNAIKYTPPGGWVRIALAAAPAQAIIRVEDNGAGIAADQLQYIFERFYRADQARNRDDPAAGFGLGLAICNWVTHAHGGTLEVVSRLGHGSSFLIRLPMAPGAG
jgi:two-component system OmpR family sensor kinase